MSLHRRAARRDASEKSIVAALEACGWTVLRVSVKDGPDIFAAKTKRVISAEIKSGKARLKPGQQAFADRWPWEHYILRHPDEVTRIR